jgi:hypothetical protein
MKRIKQLKGMTMTTSGTLSMRSCESGQKHLYKTLTGMTDGELLAELETGRTRDHAVKRVDRVQDEVDYEGTEQYTPLPTQDTPLPTKNLPLPEEYPPLLETPPPRQEPEKQSEGRRTRAQARGGGKGRRRPAARTSRQGRSQAKPPPPARESTGRAERNQRKLPPARESTGQDREEQARENEDELMLRREWEETLLKRIKHLKEMAMTAEAALSVMSYESGQKHLHKTLAAMTDGQFLSALEAGSRKLSISGAQTPSHQPRQPAKQPASQYPVSNKRNPEVHQAESTAQPSRQKKEGSKRASLTGTGPAKGRTAKRSRTQAAGNSQRETSHQRKRLKQNCPRQHRISRPMRRRLLSAIERQPATQPDSQFPASNKRNPEGHQAESTVQPSRQKKEGSKRASLTGTGEDGGDSNTPAKGRTAKRSRTQAAGNSQRETSNQRKGLKQNCPRQHRSGRPMRRRL